MRKIRKGPESAKQRYNTFGRTAAKTKKINVRARLQRGGISL